MFCLYIIYLFFLFIGIGGTLSCINFEEELLKNKLRLIFMYQYALYQIAKDDLNLTGIIILEILLTISAWFLNVAIFVFICLWYIFSTIWNLFYFVFKKR